MKRRRLIAALVFIGGLFVLDRALGSVLWSLYIRTNTGEGAGQLRHALEDGNYDMLIFGTSRARHHVSPPVLLEALGARAYNYGSNGRGVYYARIVERLALARRTRARTFLLQVEPFDLYNLHPERATVAAPLVDEDPIAYDLLARATPFGQVKLASRAYRFNSMVFPIIANLVSSAPGDSAANGFVGLGGTLQGVNPEAPLDNGFGKDAKAEFEPMALGLYRDFIFDAQRAGINVVLFGGPWFRVGPPSVAEMRALDAFRALAESADVPYLPMDERAFPELLDPSLFEDRGHLNATGAERFTRLLATELQRAKVVQSKRR